MPIPKGAFGSPYLEMGEDLKNAFDDMYKTSFNDGGKNHPAQKKNEQVEKPKVTVGNKNDVIEEIETEKVENEIPVDNVSKKFDKEIKFEILQILLNNKLNIIKMDETKIVFEYKNQKLMFLPI